MSLDVVTSITELRARTDAARAERLSVGLVPTMGFLHDGHASLMDRSVAETDLTVLTIFVNPLQFAPTEDLAAYPRDAAGDLARAAAAGAHVVFAPSVEEMYPEPVLTTVSVAEVSAAMEGASRPTHFAGVATVVAKLFSIVGPCRAYFGEKDYQQVAVVRRMVRDLSLPIDVVACPTIREPDGLAKSSRNVYLTDEEREVAPVLHRALQRGADAIRSGERDAGVVRELMRSMIDAAPLGELDYVEVADVDTLERLDRCEPPVRLFGAVRFGRARLIDNVGAEP